MLHRRINISFELIIYSIQLNAIVSFSERRFTESLSQGFFGGSLTVDSDGKSELNTSGICRIPGTGLPEEINSTTSSKLGPLMSPSGTISSPTPGAAICWNHGREGSGSLSAIRGELFSIASGTELRSPCSFHILNLAESIGVTRLMFVSDCPFEKYTWRSRNTCTCQEVPDLQENQLHYSSAPKLSSTRSDRVSTRATERCLKYLESCIILPVILLKLLVDFISHPRISHPIEIPTVKLLRRMIDHQQILQIRIPTFPKLYHRHGSGQRDLYGRCYQDDEWSSSLRSEKELLSRYTFVFWYAPVEGGFADLSSAIRMGYRCQYFGIELGL